MSRDRFQCNRGPLHDISCIIHNIFHNKKYGDEENDIRKEVDENNHEISSKRRREDCYRACELVKEMIGDMGVRMREEERKRWNWKSA